MDEIKFIVKLANTPIGASVLYESTKRFCRDYLTDEAAAFSVAVTPEDIDYERERSEPGYHFTDAYLETLALYRQISEGLLDYETLLFHGSAIAVDGEAYLFTAKSGTGKSTHTRLWREYFGERAVMVNDDKPLLRITQNGVTVFGTPWDGKHHLSANIAVPLKAVCILERSRENHIEAVTPRDAWPMLMQQSSRPSEPVKLSQVMELVDRLSKGVRLYRLGCNMQPEAVKISYQGMHSFWRERK